ncbi:MAG: MgtC/SapB family protein [Opitutaceae bacterium]
MLDIFSRLGIALGLGLLVGLQRQRTDARLAGFRTFPLVTLFGALCGLLAAEHGGWVVAGGMGALALVIVGGNLPLLQAGGERPGVTTEVTMLVMFALGVYLMAGSKAVAIATCGAVVVLLHLKRQMHSLAQKIGDRDFAAIVQFALISLVILPVLPNRVFGPFDVLNPFKIWLMVVLIVGLSLGGYVAYKLIGERAGAWANGVLGGLISSTATTVSLARRSKAAPGNPEIAAFVILIASAIVFVRVAILIGATTPQFLRAAAVPLGAMFAVLALLGWTNLRNRGDGPSAMAEPGNPTELKPALLFGALYAVVLLAVAAGNQYFGQQGLFVAAAISGLTDMDAITLSVSQLVNRHEIAAGTGWRVILVAAMANLAFKAATVAVLGERRLFSRVAVGFGVAAATGGALLFFGQH